MFCGNWFWDNDESNTFSITLNCQKNGIEGYHCAVFNEGRRIDCSFEEEITIKVINNEDEKLLVEITSGYSGTKGKAQLNLINQNSMEWILIEKPTGEYYIPSKALLVKLNKKQTK